MATIGEQLKAAREAKGVGEVEAGLETKILTRLIVAMEADDFSTIAAPAYAKGFIRIYAEYLGIDPEPLIEEYSTLHIPRSRPLVNEHTQLEKSRHPSGSFSWSELFASFFKKKTPPKHAQEHEAAENMNIQDGLHPDHHIRLIAGGIAGLIVLIVLILSISNCARRRAAENPESTEQQIKAARKILDEPMPDLYLTEPGKIETSR